MLDYNLIKLFYFYNIKTYNEMKRTFQKDIF